MRSTYDNLDVQPLGKLERAAYTAVLMQNAAFCPLQPAAIADGKGIHDDRQAKTGRQDSNSGYYCLVSQARTPPLSCIQVNQFCGCRKAKRSSD